MQNHLDNTYQAKQKGFTLIELLIVISIIGILSAIAIPSYTDYVQRGKITEATSTLADRRIAMEQYFQDNRTYVGGTCTPAAGATKYFTYACATTATTYTITATGVTSEGMTGYSYTVNQNNAKTSATPTSSGATCWLMKKGAAC